MAKTIIDELVTLIELHTSKKSERTLEKFNKGLVSFKRTALKAGTALAAMATGLTFFANKTANSIDMQNRFAKSIGLSFERLQEFQVAGQQIGTTLEDVDGGLKTISDTVASLRLGQNNPFLQRLGVSVRDIEGNYKSIGEIAVDISKNLQGLSASNQQLFGKGLGLSPGFIRLLQEGPVQLGKAFKQAKVTGSILPAKSVENITEYEKTARQLKTTLSGLARVVTATVAPALEEAAKAMEDFIQNNQALISANISGTLKDMVTGTRQFFGILEKGLNLLDSFTNKMGNLDGAVSGFKPVVMGTKIVLTGLLATLAFVAADFIAIGAAVSVAVVAIEKLIKLEPKLKKVLKRPTQVSTGIVDMFKIYAEAAFKSSPLGSLFHRGQAQAVQPNITNNQASQTAKTQNITFNITGAQSPSATAQAVKTALTLPSAAQVSSPGFNRAVVQ